MVFLQIWVVLMLVLHFGPPILAIWLTFGWAQRQNWTERPNLNGILLAAGILCAWLLLSFLVGSFVPKGIGYSTSNIWEVILSGMNVTGQGIIGLALAGLVIFFIVRVIEGFFKWLAAPRKD